jgi:hypothetical protein
MAAPVGGAGSVPGPVVSGEAKPARSLRLTKFEIIFD